MRYTVRVRDEVLLPTPCGCAVTKDSLRARIINEPPTPARDAVVECLWCGATFNYIEYMDWLSRGYVVWVSNAPRRVLALGSTAFEVHSRCQCGVPYVRECGKAHRPFHFDLSPDSVRRMDN